MLTFMSIGFSTEDQEVFKDTGFVQEFKYRSFLAESTHMSDNLSTVDIFVKEAYDCVHEYEGLKEFEDAVDELKKFVENKKGIFFCWGVEYDYNVMFVENVDEKELVDILDKLSEEEYDDQEGL